MGINIIECYYAPAFAYERWRWAFSGQEGFRMLKHDGNFSSLIGQLGADAAKRTFSVLIIDK
jgi:hypothetical protein